jgi:hypothetical protein
MTYHVGRGGRQPDPALALDRGRDGLGALLLILVLASGCSSWQARAPVVVFDPNATGSKMLRPDVGSTNCRTRLFGVTVAGDRSPLDASFRDLVRLDAEADAVQKVAIESRVFSLGVVDRTCVTVRGDVIRTTPVVRLPAPPGHEGHH